MPSYAYEGLRPVVDPTAYVHPMAVLIGDVIIAAGCYVGPGASLRGDYGRLILGVGANVQDNCTVHSFPGREVLIEEDGHIGHGAVLHGCRIGRNALIGMNSVVMDGATVGADSIVGAMSLVSSGTEIPPGTMWVGVPAGQVREVSPSEREWKIRGTGVYHELARRCLASLVECDPLSEEETDRPQLPDGHLPLREWRMRKS